MSSTYTPLGVELMATGENAGTWGTKTNANLNLFEELTGGYRVVTLNAAGTGANTTALTESDGSTVKDDIIAGLIKRIEALEKA